MLAPEFFKKLGRSWLRMHYQFTMANDMRAPYDYMMFVCGPVPVEQMEAARPRPFCGLRRDATYHAPVNGPEAMRSIQSNRLPRGRIRARYAASLLLEPGTTTRRPRISPS